MSWARGWWRRVPEPSRTEQRKAEHVNIILNENVSAEYNYWNDVHLLHRAIPEIDLDDIDVSTTLLGRKLRGPLVISSMTGGFGMGRGTAARSPSSRRSARSRRSSPSSRRRPGRGSPARSPSS